MLSRSKKSAPVWPGNGIGEVTTTWDGSGAPEMDSGRSVAGILNVGLRAGGRSGGIESEESIGGDKGEEERALKQLSGRSALRETVSVRAEW